MRWELQPIKMAIDNYPPPQFGLFEEDNHPSAPAPPQVHQQPGQLHSGPCLDYQETMHIFFGTLSDYFSGGLKRNLHKTRISEFQKPKILNPWDFLENSKVPKSKVTCYEGLIWLFLFRLYPKVVTKWNKTLNFLKIIIR